LLIYITKSANLRQLSRLSTEIDRLSKQVMQWCEQMTMLNSINMPSMTSVKMKVFKTKRNVNAIPRLQGSGFTLVELIVTIGILSILLAVAVPSMQNLIRSNRVEGEVEQFVSLLKQARSAALTSGRPSFFCRTTSARAEGDTLGNELFACRTDGLDALDWATEVLVYTQLPDRLTPDPDDRFLNQTIQDLGGPVRRRAMLASASEVPDAGIVITANQNDFVIRFNSDGTMENNAPFRLAICEQGDNAQFGRIIEIGALGQIRSTRINVDDDDRDCTPTVNI